MKNKFTVLFAMCIVLLVTIGCSFIGSDEEVSKDSSSKSSDIKSSETKKEAEPSREIVEVGIPECDELATYMNDNSEKISKENIVVQGIVEYIKQSIFSNLRDSIKQMSDEEKAKTGKNCKKALENLKKQMQK